MEAGIIVNQRKVLNIQKRTMEGSFDQEQNNQGELMGKVQSRVSSETKAAGTHSDAVTVYVTIMTEHRHPKNNG